MAKLKGSSVGFVNYCQTRLALKVFQEIQRKQTELIAANKEARL